MQPLLRLHLPFRPRLAPPPACVAPDPGPDAVVLPTDGSPLALRVRRPVRLRVHGGRAWITRDGWPDDHWLEPGQTLDLPVSPSWFGWRILASGEGASLVTLKAEALA
ncbi:DUF2917 domain-containing protein [Mitsuaria sp. GD03876]|uniref:DUF2917 domain-containing protein n=1 Tax=Mitsuaria sp. GD03876 TaxID=2975399 RepID=UPI002449544C|nr:DUF2917 domain-containing protein [Mitsuaria sp. GD03876]MDH0863738.1 DUF2917 domain-containing protein [Mitsuaria sp. GD03876]